MRERAGNSGTSAGNSSSELYVLTVVALNGIRSSMPGISSSTGLLLTRTKASPAPSSTCLMAITDAPVNVACAFGRSKAPSAYGATPLPI
jgi:hypothetical protein